MKVVLLLMGILCLESVFLQASAAVSSPQPDPMGGIPSRDELKRRRARATNAPVAFAINPAKQTLEVRDIDGKMIEEYPSGTIGRVLDGGGYELRVSFGRDEHRRLSLMVRPGPAQSQPVQISVFQRRLILPPGTSVSAAMEKDDGVVTIDPCLTGTIYYLDTEPTSLDVPADKVRFISSKNLVRIGKDVQQGKLPGEDAIDAVVQGPLATEEKQTPKNNAGVAVGSWLQNATVSLMGLPNPEAPPPATIVKVSEGTPELSAPANASLTPNMDTKPVVQERNPPPSEVTQKVKIIALKSGPSDAVAPQKPFPYEEGSRGDLQKASRQGLSPRPLQDPSLAAAPPAESLNQKPPGDLAGNSVVRALRSFLGMPEASTVRSEEDELAGKKAPTSK